ncbi:MAG: hypothetical protein MK116_13845, partial [Phycisphaerales bacterium]|nr:hypothetical protein [Phycisphaerales bacterium]
MIKSTILLLAMLGTPAPATMSSETNAVTPVNELLQTAQDAIVAGDDATARAALAAARQQMKMPDPRVTFNEAISAYRMGDYAGARDLFAVAAEDARVQGNQDLASAAAYNLGNAAHREAMQALETPPADNQVQDMSGAIESLKDARSQLGEAMNHYRSAIGRDADDADARANAELTW